MPCPLCLLGIPEGEHSQEMFRRIATKGDPLHDRLEVILSERRKKIRAEEEAAGLPPGSIIG